MKRLFRAPYLTNFFLFVIVCELVLLTQRREGVKVTIAQEGEDVRIS
jgi:hypothetical protein